MDCRTAWLGVSTPPGTPWAYQGTLFRRHERALCFKSNFFPSGFHLFHLIQTQHSGNSPKEKPHLRFLFTPLLSSTQSFLLYYLLLHTFDLCSINDSPKENAKKRGGGFSEFQLFHSIQMRYQQKKKKKTKKKPSFISLVSLLCLFFHPGRRKKKKKLARFETATQKKGDSSFL